MKEKWAKKWDVVGTSGKEYVVSQTDSGMFGCSCPAWLFQRRPLEERRDCQHILKIKLELVGKLQIVKAEKKNPTLRRIRFED